MTVATDKILHYLKEAEKAAPGSDAQVYALIAIGYSLAIIAESHIPTYILEGPGGIAKGIDEGAQEKTRPFDQQDPSS
jgi:hypothetical protein